MMKRIGRAIRKQPIDVEQFADGVHPLAPPPNYTPLATRHAAHRTFRLTGLVHERRIEATDTGGDDLAIVLIHFYHRPAARRDAEIDAEDTLTLPHRGTPTPLCTTER